MQHDDGNLGGGGLDRPDRLVLERDDEIDTVPDKRLGSAPRGVFVHEVAPVEAAAPAPSAEPMATDRWQQFVSALASCERETLIVGLVCKERARLRYCESAWGELPHCPVAVASLNTR